MKKTKETHKKTHLLGVYETVLAIETSLEGITDSIKREKILASIGGVLAREQMRAPRNGCLHPNDLTEITAEEREIVHKAYLAEKKKGLKEKEY